MNKKKDLQEEKITKEEQPEMNEVIEEAPEENSDIPENDDADIEDDESAGENQEEDKEEAVEPINNEVFEYRDKLLRKIAEFENYKKRTSEEFLRLIDTANQDLILKILPILDDLERMEKNYKPEMKQEDLKTGVDMIFNKFKNVLSNLGLEEIEVIGKEFDPDIHEALLQMEANDVEPHTILDQHEKGYKLKEKIIRHSKVIVAK